MKRFIVIGAVALALLCCCVTLLAQTAPPAGRGAAAQPPAPAPGVNEKKARLKNLYHRLLAEAAGSGLTESELLSFIKERNPTTL